MSSPRRLGLRAGSALSLALFTVVAQGAAAQTTATTSAAREADPALALVPSVGFGWSSEDHVGSDALHFRAGARLDWRFAQAFSLSAMVRNFLYRREYVSSQPDVSGRAFARTELAEQKVDLDAVVLFEATRFLGVDASRWSAAAGLGPSLRFFVNEALPSNAGGVALVARASVALSSAVDLSGGGAWAYNVLFQNADLQSALGGPLSVTGWHATLWFRLPPGARLGLGYEGEAVAHRNSYRLFHSATLTLNIGL